MVIDAKESHNMFFPVSAGSAWHAIAMHYLFAGKDRQGMRLERICLPSGSDTMSEQAKTSEGAMDGDRE
ncbi:MAG: hypothetical protein C4538_06505 [Nitrospiraceae bacterium]|nr:MAG: hypothetical protein C4538_06505 [Nitrospiraceae bacterium]